MPIQFRCQHCNQKLSITRRRAGSDVKCPACAEPIRVPTLEEASAALAVKAARKSARTAKDETPAEPESDSELQRAAVEDRQASPPPEPEHVPPELAELWKVRADVDPWQSEEDDDSEEEFQILRPAGDESEMDMTPMVDVTFLLLIFFMITASFSLQKSMQTEAPEPEEEGAAQTLTIQDIEEASIIVTIDAEDNIAVDDAPVTSLGQLVEVLTSRMFEQTPPRSDMLIEADYGATHGAVVAVTDAGMEAGMQSIRRVSRRNED